MDTSINLAWIFCLPNTFFLMHTDRKDTKDDQDGTEDAAGRPGRPNIAPVLRRLSPIG